MASAKAMPISQLPTVADVISHINYLKNSARRLNKPAMAEATGVIICDIWKHTDIPIINMKSITNRINRLIEKIANQTVFVCREGRTQPLAESIQNNGTILNMNEHETVWNIFCGSILIVVRAWCV
jgi:hypothetical protein